MSNFDWNKAFENISIDEKVKLLNETLLTIFKNCIPNKKTTCDYRQPPSMTDNIKKSLKEKCKLTKIFYKNGQRKTDFVLEVLEKSSECNEEILEPKENYILKMSKKAQILILLDYMKPFENDILAIIKALDPNNISIKMIKICGQSLTLTSKIIFEQSLQKGKIPELWKKENVVPAHKKEDNIVVKNYRTISLLPIFGKMLERVIYNSIFNYFLNARLFTPSQSGFLQGNSCVA